MIDVEPRDATPDQIRDAAIHELRTAIVALECGEEVSAANHARHSLMWMGELR
jgi:hypothetical protein